MLAVNGHSAIAIQPAHSVMENVRRAQEFYRYLQPDNLIQPHLRRRESVFDVHHEHVPSLSAALAPFCQLTVLRCNATKAMLNVMDRDVMYFLAESTRKRRTDNEIEAYDFVEDPIFLSCSSVPLEGRICEMTIRTKDQAEGGTSLFVIPDLTQSQFAHLPIVTGTPYYRFYAGVPITTRDGINIGSLAIMDDKVRPDGLTPEEEVFLSQTAHQIMIYLETNRQAIDGRRSRRMAQGLEGFIAGKGTISDMAENRIPRKTAVQSTPLYGLPVGPDVEASATELKPRSQTSRSRRRNSSIVSMDSYPSTSELSTENGEVKQMVDGQGESRSHAKTFARAANLLRECMGDLGEGGRVCFQSLQSRLGVESRPTAFSQGMSPSSPSTKEQSVAADTELSKSIDELLAPIPAQLIAFSSEKDPFGTSSSLRTTQRLLDADRLRDFMRRYPNGHLWSMGDNNYSSSEEEIQDKRQSSKPNPPSHRRPSNRKQLEFAVLQSVFPGARQVLFAPLWDATIGSSAHGVFVVPALETRPFNATSDLSFLNAFCSTLMAECSRLDTMMADKQKSDFVGTISHEMRSPLHGVLASVEFLAETEVNGFQKSLVDTIDSCGRTLLDTINHVLDFSKVNSFQKQWQESNKKSVAGGRRSHYLGPGNSSRSLSSGAPPLLQLFAISDVSVILEEVVDGLVLGNTYSSGIDITDTSREARGRDSASRSSVKGSMHVDDVDIALDVERADWTFLTQPGAVRRIIMNITGNAIKYTSHGHIDIQLRLKETQEPGDAKYAMILTVSDTGIGISPEFLARRLFVPFAQENALAPGTGLGMSIVQSIILMLGGTIDVKSTVGQGTTVTVILPLQRPLPGQALPQSTPGSASTNPPSSSNSETLRLLQTQATDASVTYYRRTPEQHDQRASMVEKYVKDWYHINYIDSELMASASVVVVEEEDLDHLIQQAVGTPGRRPAIVVLCSVSSKHSAKFIQSLEMRVSSAVEFVAKPFGPHKLARSIRMALEKKKGIRPRFAQVANLEPVEEVQSSRPTLTPRMSTNSVRNTLQAMDLNSPGETDAGKLVQATETFAASQSSQHAQMAINDPKITTPTLSGHHLLHENQAFPFPLQVEQHARMPASGEISDRQSGDAPSDPRNGLALRTSQSTTGHENNQGFDAHNPRVLLVDDNKINLKLLETFLRSKRKYTRIARAEDGQQAVDTFIAAKEPFDIVFMDISMPVLNGFEATRAIREYEAGMDAKPGAMVIALTGLANGRDQSEGFDSGCDIYMTKPVSFKEVGKLLDNWEEHQTLILTTNRQES